MTLNNKFKIESTETFKDELENIVYYIRYNLKEPEIARRLYKRIQKEINSLEYFPDKFIQVPLKNKKLRRIVINNYIIVYEVKRDTRSDIYFTYIS